MKKIITPNRTRVVFVKESHGLQIYLRGMIYCCPDLMLASRYLEGLEKKIAKIWTSDTRKNRYRKRYD